MHKAKGKATDGLDPNHLGPNAGWKRRAHRRTRLGARGSGPCLAALSIGSRQPQHGSSLRLRLHARWQVYHCGLRGNRRRHDYALDRLRSPGALRTVTMTEKLTHLNRALTEHERQQAAAIREAVQQEFP